MNIDMKILSWNLQYKDKDKDSKYGYGYGIRFYRRET